MVVEEGDVIFINTRLWWHQTVLGPQSGEGLSVSYARDFYLNGKEALDSNLYPHPHPNRNNCDWKEALDWKAQPKTNVDGVHAPRDARKGETVLTEEEVALGLGLVLGLGLHERGGGRSYTPPCGTLIVSL